MVPPGASGEAGVGLVELDADDLLDEMGSSRPRPRPSAAPSPAPGVRSDVLPRRPRRPAADARPADVGGPTTQAAVSPAMAAAARSAMTGSGVPGAAAQDLPRAAVSGLPGAAAPSVGGAAAGPAGRAGPVVPSRRQRQAARRLQARKVGRLVRHVDLWSVFKLALLFHLAAFLIALLAGTLLWAVAVSTGVVGDLEGFIREAFALEQFSFDGRRIFRAATLGGLTLVGAATVVSVLLAALFNLISDVVGGVRFTVVEEETARPRPIRRPPTGP